MNENAPLSPAQDQSNGGDRFRFAKALLAFLALPGMVAFVIPLWMAPTNSGSEAVHWLGIPVLVLGILILLWCVRDFYVAGKGTLAPWSPPRNLVVVGLYRLSRNPMYLGVLTILFGWSLWFGSRGLLMYALILVVAFHLRVVLFEEPWLARTHGSLWDDYRGRVPRWLGMLPRRRLKKAVH